MKMTEKAFNYTISIGSLIFVCLLIGLVFYTDHMQKEYTKKFYEDNRIEKRVDENATHQITSYYNKDGMVNMQSIRKPIINLKTKVDVNISALTSEEIFAKFAEVRR